MFGSLLWALLETCTDFSYVIHYKGFTIDPQLPATSSEHRSIKIELI
jgi:hypothetical protein